MHRDYQGSILAVSNSAGVLVEKRLFDAWGEVVLVKDGNNNSLPKLTFFDRGYTGHEHLQSVGLIHMNGRLYDAKLHRFLQPDNYVQDPYNTQNYNRYGYVLNNPLKYTDPSGEEITLLTAIVVSAIISALTYTATTFFSGQQITVKGFATAVIIGAISGAVTFGIGEWATSIGNFYARAGAQALMHGTFQGGMTAVQGGKFWTGFASGALSSLVSSAWQGGNTIETKFQANGDYTSGHFFKEITKHQGVSGALGIGNKTISTMLLGSITGGAGAALAKGNFWQGAVTGLIVSGLNHAAHSAFDGEEDPPKYKYKDKTYDNKASLYKDILIDQAAEQFGIKDILALGTAIDGMGFIDKPFQMKGASEGTSLLSKGLSKALPQKMSFRLPTISNRLTLKFTNVLGRFIGRSIPIIGWGILAYDVGMTIYNTQVIYNRITN